MNRPHPRVYLTLIHFIAVFACTCATMGQSVPSPNQLQQAAARTGNLALGELAEFRNTYLSEMTIQAPKFSENGSVSGTTTMAGHSSKVVLHYVETNAGMGRWILATKLPGEKLGDLAPAVRGSVADQLNVGSPIIIFCKQATTLLSRNLDSAIRDFYAEVYGSGEFELHIQDGINLLATAGGSAEIQSGADMLGLDLEKLLLQGCILKNFDSDELKQAKRDGKLIKAMAREAELRARLTNLTIQGLPQEFQVRDLALLVTGQPTVGLEFFLTAGSGRDQRDFRCRANFLLANQDNNGRQGVSISATSDVDRPWRNALGIQGLEMRDLTMEIRYERASTAAPPTVLIGVGGKMKFADKLVEVVGGLQTKAGVLIGFFKGSINSIHRDDVVAVINDACAARGNRAAVIDARGLPEFELRNVSFNFAPMGGSDQLGIESGIGLQGELVLFGSVIGQVEVLGDANQPLIRLSADVNRFQIADIELRDAQLDVLMAGAADSHFRFTGSARVMDIEATAEADLGAHQTSLRMSGKIANTFAADLLYRTPSLENPVWEFEAGFRDDFSRRLGAQIASDIRKWAEKTKTEFDQAAAQIDQAKRDVNKINNDIAKMRQQVESERKQHQAALTQAQQEVQKIDRQIANMRRTVQSERNRHLGAIQSAESKVQEIQRAIDAQRDEVHAQRRRDLSVHQRDRDTAKRNYDKAQRAFKSAETAWKKEKNPLKKVKKGITKDAKGVARDAKKAIYYAAKKKYDVAKAAMDRVPVDADPKIVALLGSMKTAQAALRQARRVYQSVTRGLSVDADPRIAGLFAARDSAMLTLRGAKKAFDLAHRVSVNADPRVASLIAARESARTALDSAKLAVDVSGDAVQLATDVLAAAAQGQIISVQSARLRGKVAAYESGGRVELEANVLLLDKPRSIKLSVSAKQLQNGEVFGLVASALVPKA